MRFAYADPPYHGCCKLYDHYHPDGLCWDDPDTHDRLVTRLMDYYSEGWALSCSSTSLKRILLYCPAEVRIAAWVWPWTTCTAFSGQQRRCNASRWRGDADERRAVWQYTLFHKRKSHPNNRRNRMTVKLAGKLPKSDDANGLDVIEDALKADPTATHVAIVVLNAQKLTLDTDSGDTTPTARVLRIEIIDGKDDKKRLRNLATRAYEARTGKTTLPLDLEDEVRAAFGDEGGEQEE